MVELARKRKMQNICRRRGGGGAPVRWTGRMGGGGIAESDWRERERGDKRRWTAPIVRPSPRHDPDSEDRVEQC